MINPLLKANSAKPSQQIPVKRSLRSILTLGWVTVTTLAGLGGLSFAIWDAARGGYGDLSVEHSEGPVPLAEMSVKPNTTAYDSLRVSGFTPQEIFELVQISKPYQNLSRIRAGTRYQLFGTQGPLGRVDGVKFIFSPTHALEILRSGDVTTPWAVREIHEVVETKLVTYAGKVTSSLWESASDAEMDSSLIAELTEIFAWQVDFSREVQSGDHWRLTVEQRLVRGKPIGWGKIIAAEYQNVKTLYSAVLFRREGQDVGYFAPDGSSLRRMFLKAPIAFGRITSRFKRQRFHPILQINRPHLGVDYGAPPGTPIRAVGDGVVVFAAPRGGAGNKIQIRHNSVYATAYLHLQGFAAGIRSGARVRQGQIIGYVGSTGLSTGPHLHFEFYENGRFIDPSGKRFPSADPVPSSELAGFQAWATQALTLLPPKVDASDTSAVALSR